MKCDQNIARTAERDCCINEYCVNFVAELVELKDCPFCGEKAEMLNYSNNEWLVHCTVCDGMIEK